MQQILNREYDVSGADISARDLASLIYGGRGILETVEVVPHPGRGNACSELSPDNQRRIYVDEDWLNRYSLENYWFKYFIIAHEIGHLSNFHEGANIQDKWKLEFQADYFAGRSLAIAGASPEDLEPIQVALGNCLAVRLGSHPPCRIRALTLEMGYEGDFLNQAPSARSFATSPEQPVSAREQGEDAVSEQELAREVLRSEDFSSGSSSAIDAVTQLSETGLQAIAEFEGFSQFPYNDSEGQCVVGFGHIIQATPCDSEIPQDLRDGISADAAYALLRQDLEIIEQLVDASVYPPLEQGQFDALVSFAFNVGVINFTNSTLLKRVNDRDFEGAAAEFPKWTYRQGEVLPGLQRRRDMELTLFSAALIDDEG